MQKFEIPSARPPLPRTYWVLDRMFLAGAYAGQPDPKNHKARLSGLFDAGMRTFINLMEEDETNNEGKRFVAYAADLQEIAKNAGEKIESLRFPIVDQSITTQEHMVEILDTIDRSLADSKPVYVHCFGGIGRTGTVVCCWLLRHGYATSDNVFEVIKELRKADTERSWREAPENEKQRKFVLDSIKELGRTLGKKTPTSQRSPLPIGNDWFAKLTGFTERSPDEVRANISVKASQLSSKVNGKSYECGRLEILSLQELRERVSEIAQSDGNLQLAELVGDAKALHADEANQGALFQVASQFNLLEMVSPTVTPERGISIYEHDPTQGPACAIACGAGTIYRNYFVELDGQIGQTVGKQINCLADIGEAIGNPKGRLWAMKNGYVLPTAEGLKEVDSTLGSMSEAELDELRAKLKIGLQWDTQVTLGGSSHLVTQAYCSALPVAYSGLSSRSWEKFARLILEAAYEATLAAAVLNASKTGNHSVYLTLLGGGAFGNDQRWILDAMRRAFRLNQDRDVNVNIVSFRASNSAVRELVDRFATGSQSRSSVRREPAPPHTSDHYCPGCGAAQKIFLRYPWYFCQDCLNLAEDGSGRRLDFGNMSLSGGLCYYYADSGEVGEEDCGTVLCLIHGRPVVITEARFGGVVAQPLNSEISDLTNSYKVVDLRANKG